MDFSIIISKVLSIIILFIFGFFFRKYQFLAPRTIEDIKKLILNISLPSLLFLSFSSTKIQNNHLVIIGTIFLVCLLLLLIGVGLRKFFGIKSPFFPLLLTGFEAGMVGYSIFSILFGTENVFKFAIIDLGQVTFVFFIMVAILVKFRDEGTASFKELVASFAKTPVIVAIFLGIIVEKTGLIDFVSNFTLTTSLLETLSLIGTLTTPLICLVIGYELNLDVSALNKAFKIIIVRLTLVLILGLSVNHFIIDGLLQLDRTFQAAVLVMFLLPPPFIIPLYIHTEDKNNKKLVINTLSLHTIFTIFAMLIVGALYL